MRYVLSPAAQRDLDEIWDYTAERWDRAQANLYIAQIRSILDDLANGTRRDRPASDVRQGYRRYPVGAHMIFLRDHPKAAFEVVRILHQRMDVHERLK